MAKEIMTLEANGTQTLDKQLDNQKPIDYKWVDKIKVQG